MDSERYAKRRKLNPSQLSPQKRSRDAASSPITYSRKDNAQKVVNGDQKTSSYNAWLEAKAKAKSASARKPPLPKGNQVARGLHNNVERGYVEKSPFKKQDVPASTPTKKQLDPLRNQRTPTSATSSPSKGASLDFFKQFHQPRQTNGASKPKSSKSLEVIAPETSHPEDELSDDEDAVVGAEFKSDGRREGMGNHASDQNAQAELKRSWKGWAYEKPKKTFEDEIKELEDAAREQADKGEEADAADSTPQTRPKRANLSTSGSGQKGGSEKRASGSKQYQMSNRKKDRTVKQGKDERSVEVQLEDKMEISEIETEEGRIPIPNGIQARLKAAQTVAPSKATPQKTQKAPTIAAKTQFDAGKLGLLQGILLDKLTGKRHIRLVNLDEEYTKVSNLITQTIMAGESNSMLLIGARGCGKTTVVNQILREQAVQHRDDFLVVRLNGFIHTDDKTALREIWRQLGREMKLDEDEATSKNYADTLATLLALLSHPTEQGREQTDQVTKSVIFILDEFELFASHPRQTLLYNLFDIAQSRKAPIAVLGLTTRIDVAESLEKRVKSRFSHRYVHLSMAKSFAAFQEACKASMTIDTNELTPEEREEFVPIGSAAGKFTKAMKNTQSSLIGWNAFVETLLSETLTSHLKRIYYTTKSVPEFQSSMLLAIASLPERTTVTADDLLTLFAGSIVGSILTAPDSKLNLLSSLNTLQLALLICAARMTAIHDADTVPFLQVYEEYKVLASKAKLQASASGALAQGAGSRVWSKEVAKGAWEDLAKFGLVLDDGSRGGRVDIGLEEIGISGVELGSWGRWCSEI